MNTEKRLTLSLSLSLSVCLDRSPGGASLSTADDAVCRKFICEAGTSESFGFHPATSGERRRDVLVSLQQLYMK